LYPNDALKVMVWLQEKAPKPLLPSYCLGKIEPVKNGKFFFGMKNRDIIKSDFIYLHWQ
jgi:hypothetical protein